MVKLESFGGLAKKQEDLLQKSYPLGALTALTLTSKQGELTFHARGSQRLDTSGVNVLASAWLEFKKNQFVSKLKRRNDGEALYSMEWTPSDYVKNTKLKAEYKIASGKHEPVISAEYSHEQFKGKLAVGHGPTCVKTSMTLGKPEYGLGLDGKFDVESARFHSYNVAFWWFRKYSRVVFKHEGSNKEQYDLGKFKASIYQKIGCGHIATLAEFNWHSKAVTLKFGGDYKYDSSLTFKARADSDGLLAGSLTKVLSPTLKLVAAAQLDTTKISASAISDLKVGVHLDFNH